MTTYTQAAAKLGPIAAETTSIAQEIHAAATAAGHDVWFIWGNGPGEHSTGHALDFMVRTPQAGQFVRDYIWRNRARLRLRHAIWNQRITSVVKYPGQVRLMADRGSVTENHKDHVHVLFYAGTYRKPEAAPAAPSKPKPAPADPTLQRGSTGERVRKLQQGLRAVFPAYAGRLVVDGSFGPATDKALREFQRRSGLAVDGKAGPATRRILLRYGINIGS